jgi:L-lactate dehydrogenase complex protein LldG
MSNSAKNRILKKIRMALAQPTPLPFPDSEKPDSVFQPQQDDLLVQLAETFTQLQGKFVYCANNDELIQNFAGLCFQNSWTKLYTAEPELRNIIPPDQWHGDIASCDLAITSCESLVARTGSIVLSSSEQGRIPSVYAPVHICVAFTSQLVYDIKDGLAAIKERYGQELPSLITFATGPSRTADIEKTLVVGVHGPKEVYCFVIEDQQSTT